MCDKQNVIQIKLRLACQPCRLLVIAVAKKIHYFPEMKHCMAVPRLLATTQQAALVLFLHCYGKPLADTLLTICFAH